MSHLFHAVAPLQRALDFHQQRHNVLASNIANVDTPGFKPQELLRELPSEHRSPRLTTTDQAHMGLGAQQGGAPFTAAEETGAAGADGNAVSLEREMSKIAANDLRYDGVAQLVARHTGMLRYAANDGQ